MAVSIVNNGLSIMNNSWISIEKGMTDVGCQVFTQDFRHLFLHFPPYLLLRLLHLCLANIGYALDKFLEWIILRNVQLIKCKTYDLQ